MKITINGKELQAAPGETINDVAKKIGINIPTLCFHPDLPATASCRVCVVEVNGRIMPACSTIVEDGMNIETTTNKARRARKINLELLFSQHQEECHDCVWLNNCKMLDLAKEYGVEINRFTDRKKNYPVYRFGESLEYDSSKCIDCRNCVEVCHRQAVNFLELQENNHSIEVVPSQKEDVDCIYCGQCIVRCPSGSFEAVGEFEDVKDPFKSDDKIIVFQIAPAVRSAAGEGFNVPYGTPVLNKLVTALKRIGADYVFDVSSGADITTIEESTEFVEKVKSNNLPLFTSCCPSWVRFVEFYYPDFIPNLTSVRSPHIILGGVIKKYLAEKNNISADKIIVISVMPCVSKKHEISRPQILIDGVKPVDFVMTTREISRLLQNHDIDLNNIEDSEPDTPFGSPTGSAEAYGVSGGVMNSAYHNITGEELDFCSTSKGISTTEIEAFGKKLKLAVVFGIANGKKILEELKQDKNKYDFVEVMACPGGCIGGGGQPVPVDEDIRSARRRGLCVASSTRVVKKACENPETKKIYEEILSSDEIIKKICHTSYNKAYKSGALKMPTGQKPCE